MSVCTEATPPVVNADQHFPDLPSRGIVEDVALQADREVAPARRRDRLRLPGRHGSGLDPRESANAIISRNVYDAADQLLQVQDGYLTTDQATEVTWTYTQNGKRLTLTDANSNRTTFEYDGLDRRYRTSSLPTTRIPARPPTMSSSRIRRRNGNVTCSPAARRHQHRAHGYDNLSRLIAEGRARGRLCRGRRRLHLRSARAANERLDVGADRRRSPTTGSAA